MKKPDGRSRRPGLSNSRETQPYAKPLEGDAGMGNEKVCFACRYPSGSSSESHVIQNMTVIGSKASSLGSL